MPPGTGPSLPYTDEPGNWWQILPRLKSAILCHRFYACLQLATVNHRVLVSGCPHLNDTLHLGKSRYQEKFVLSRGLSSNLEATKLDFLFSAQLLQTDILFELNSIPLPVPLPHKLSNFPGYIFCKMKAILLF